VRADDDPIDDDATDWGDGGGRTDPRFIARSTWDLKVPREVGGGVGGGDGDEKGRLLETRGVSFCS
jgi:hypothetical protein